MAVLSLDMVDKSFWKTLPKPIIGLSPMDGYTDSAFRRTCKAVYPDLLVYTEFTSADGLSHKAKRVQQKLHFDLTERPILAQIFGKNIESFKQAAKFCEEMGFTGIDLNMGCPSKKVVKSEHGVALRQKPELAGQLIEAVASATTLPVSVKTRLGWTDASDLIEFGKLAENSGADMICIHARTYHQPYNVPAQWQPLYDLKEAVSIPVLGNGGITSVQDGMQKAQPLDGFLIGQAAIGNPWVFDPTNSSPDFLTKIPLIKRHAAWLIETKGELVGTREMRKHLLAYVKAFKGAKSFRKQIVYVGSLNDIEAVLDDIGSRPLQLAA